MSRRLLCAALLAMMVIPATSQAKPDPATLQPSQYCDGSTPSSPPVEMYGNLTQPTVCFQFGGGEKGAIVIDRSNNSAYFDGDKTNGTFNSCLDGYAGVYAGGSGTDPHVVWSQGGNYDPSQPESDGGTDNHGAGASNDRFDPLTETGEVLSCVG